MPRPPMKTDVAGIIKSWKEGNSMGFIGAQFNRSRSFIRSLLLKEEQYTPRLSSAVDPMVAQFSKLFTGKKSLNDICIQLDITRAHGTTLAHKCMIDHHVPTLPAPRTVKELLVHNTWRDKPTLKESWRDTSEAINVPVRFIRAYVKREPPIKRGSHLR